ncbi:hypothetical protein SAMN04487944_101193 [Gracilibacillus ureilyticus]|uniref:Uncharacterized protein n=1 Tax=Gracilibacillus ureilyticus TaxID=531814 RepID=A0A1H9LCX1_9BACI|nr:hypothetical protein [Gracilibacillus ureilyticus]SER09037.1 hypothetical protein SAMN04487944_101193 [Gracilibacillus ureilyticus]
MNKFNEKVDQLEYTQMQEEGLFLLLNQYLKDNRKRKDFVNYLREKKEYGFDQCDIAQIILDFE